MNELDILKLVASRLNDAEIDYMISGSVALTFYGKPRMTRDIDIVSLIDLDFDMDYVEEWCARLGLNLILRRVLNERHK